MCVSKYFETGIRVSNSEPEADLLSLRGVLQKGEAALSQRTSKTFRQLAQRRLRPPAIGPLSVRDAIHVPSGSLVHTPLQIVIHRSLRNVVEEWVLFVGAVVHRSITTLGNATMWWTTQLLLASQPLSDVMPCSNAPRTPQELTIKMDETHSLTSSAPYSGEFLGLYLNCFSCPLTIKGPNSESSVICLSQETHSLSILESKRIIHHGQHRRTPAAPQVVEGEFSLSSLPSHFPRLYGLGSW